MEQTANSSKGFQITVVVFLLISLGNIAYLDWNWIKAKEVNNSSLQLQPQTQEIISTDECDVNCLKQVNQMVSQALATLSAQPKQSNTKVVTVNQTSKSGTTYIPLNGSNSTLRNDWTDLSATDIYIKVEDYGKSPYISFEASLKASHEGGRVYARLFDVTNGIAVDGSELSTDSQSFSSLSTGNLPLWSGNNLYRVQIKSLDNQEVSYSSGRVKIVTK
jgi:hypothetical protein